jgi:hypothetical protein
MAQPLEKDSLTKRLAAQRAPVMISGSRLIESASFLKQARLALLNWTKEVYTHSDQVDQHTHEVMEVLGMANQLENLRMKLDVKASRFGA